MIELVVLGLFLLFALVVLFRTVRIVPQQTALIIERLGRYSRTLEGGIHFLIPFVDKVRANVDLREQVVSFPPQPVITSDNLVVNIDTVIYYSVIDAKSAVYEIANFIQGIEQLTVTTLRNVIGSLDLEQTLTSRTRSMPSCAGCWTRPRASGGSGSTASSSRPSTRRCRFRSRWRSR